MFGLVLAALAVSKVRPEGPWAGLAELADPVLNTVVLAALLLGRAARSGRERLFWDLYAWAWGCLLLIEAFFFFELPIPFVAASFVADALHVSFYMLLALAVDLWPDRVERASLSTIRRRIESVAGLFVVFGLLFYFALVVLPEPLGLSLSFVARGRGITPFLLVRLSLDVLLFGRFVQAWLRAEGRWRGTYAFLAASFFCFGVKDALSIAQAEELLSLASLGLLYQLFLYLPSLLVLAAVRYGPPASDDDAVSSAQTDTEFESESLRYSPLALYALVVPGMHFLLYPLGLLEPASRTPREVFCLFYLCVLGATIWLHQRLMAKDNQRAREELHEAQTRLFRSERLESIGRLAGGIAHDFNNYLTVIQGYGELVEATLDDSETKTELGYIREAADQAGKLTRQLLAFGRRQLLRPESIDLNEVVTSTGQMLGRLLGEDVELEYDLDRESSPVLADLGQTEQVFVNLALNGRDAMPGGGKLTVRTRRMLVDENQAERFEIEPGAYVELAVSDTGSGMTEAVRDRAFEPFFTTKAVGRGTGLGLSTVYGIVSQSGGAIEIESAVHRGTTVRVLLPEAEAPVEAEPDPAFDPAAARSGATVLLVEDEGAVRRLAERALADRDFKVLVASNGDEALELFSAHGRAIDILVTDVVMPKMDGFELAKIMVSSYPGLPVLYISGYPTATLRQRHADLPQGTPLLSKPFTASALVREVDRLLDDRLAAPAGPGATAASRLVER